jgi:uncharacterized protein (DUF488 family)
VRQGATVVVYTIGHSTHPIDHFIGLLKSNAIAHLLDVRTVPRSRHNPQFAQENLRDALAASDIRYTHVPDLGGLRKPCADSVNVGWRNSSFRGYADYMQTPAFTEAVERVIALAQTERCVLMCAEAVPWRCHRSLIADALIVRGVRVEDIVGAAMPVLHRMTPFARVEGISITYPTAERANGELFDRTA